MLHVGQYFRVLSIVILLKRINERDKKSTVRKSDEHTVGFNAHPINFVTPSSKMPRNDRWERTHPCGALSLTDSDGPWSRAMNLLVIFKRTEYGRWFRLHFRHADWLSEYLIYFLIFKTDRYLIWKNWLLRSWNIPLLYWNIIFAYIWLFSIIYFLFIFILFL